LSVDSRYLRYYYSKILYFSSVSLAKLCDSITFWKRFLSLSIFLRFFSFGWLRYCSSCNRTYCNYSSHFLNCNRTLDSFFRFSLSLSFRSLFSARSISSIWLGLLEFTDFTWFNLGYENCLIRFLPVESDFSLLRVWRLVVSRKF
jgi:hypothetical protein